MKQAHPTRQRKKEQHLSPRFFPFLHFSFLFCRNIWSEKNCKTIHLAPWGTALGTYIFLQFFLRTIYFCKIEVEKM
jgi:hypothetical protein